ncbi:MAG: hypothetical protein AW11_00755 [Candidatus Accumulibacter regalis]|uniref:Uncharacterized protein n=1 Tax=Accumulibacter regalis TaxID=522306 RepID=A0A011QMZ6_ACCRE|nr:hypothetical protein [Accumulibacter sp.]EXI90400.1 MAG: hypothetical protein AW11_00755 [Candidatus Accumulibacter regalis]MBN8515578.1 hypothetical protein [Accumulibacter sp.]MBO3702634.1 hypothetical protein [Accumulibacter sp.]HRE70783.1 hypothetical protein [Accumulibacter sp.]HRE84810.1 hypothetical protein [Accumulibacter sp.]
MNRISLLVDRLRLSAEIAWHRHGPWWLLLALTACLLLLVSGMLVPALHAELVEKQDSLRALQTRVPGGAPPVEAPESASERHYQAFREVLAEESQVLATIQAVLDSAVRHQLLSTRAEYQRGRDLQAQVDTLQMTVPVSGRYADVRRWIEEILATQAFVAVNELGFKRDEIGRNEIEAKVRLTIWHHRARAAERLRGARVEGADAAEAADVADVAEAVSAADVVNEVNEVGR